MKKLFISFNKRVLINIYKFQRKCHSNIDYDYSCDYYKILNLSPISSREEIKNKYFLLAKKSHPDLVKGKTNEFLQISKAYEVLYDEKSKLQYDNARILHLKQFNSVKKQKTSEEKKNYANKEKSFVKNSDYYTETKKNNKTSYYEFTSYFNNENNKIDYLKAKINLKYDNNFKV